MTGNGKADRENGHLKSQSIILSVDSNYLRGFSNKWRLELGDGKRVVVSMGIERQLSGFFKGSVLDELVAMDYSGNSSRPLAVQSEGDGVMVE